MRDHVLSLLSGWKHAFVPYMQWIGKLKKQRHGKGRYHRWHYCRLGAALFGSSRQLATGPVAVVSLMTAAVLEPLATSVDSYLAYAMLLALMVGVFQIFLGLFKLGVLMDFVSHPVVVGFTNAGALSIATSQFGKLFGVHADRSEHHYETVWNILLDTLDGTHYPTLLLDGEGINQINATGEEVLHH